MNYNKIYTFYKNILNKINSQTYLKNSITQQLKFGGSVWYCVSASWILMYDTIYSEEPKLHTHGT
jgi:hypothetical protein